MSETSYDVEAVRRQFPVTKHMLYLDSANQTPLASCVRDALQSFYTEGNQFAGPKSLWLERVEQVRARLAAFLGAAPDEIAFTKNTSEGMNIAANALPLTAGDNVLLVEGDHPNNAYAFLNLKRKGVNVRFVPLRGETATAESFEANIDARTRAISLSHVTFHAGHRFDLGSIEQLCADRGLHLIVDAMQSVGVLQLDAHALGASFIGFGCHKGLLVPQGLGVLYCRSGLEDANPPYLALASLANPPADFIARADNMALKSGAGRFEIGNLNLADIHALGASLDLIEGIGVAQIEDHLYALGDLLIERLDALGIGLVGPRARTDRAPHIYVLDLPVDAWMEHLSKHQVRVTPERGGIRVSFGMFNTIEDVDRLTEILADGLRAMPLSAQALA